MSCRTTSSATQIWSAPKSHISGSNPTVRRGRQLCLSILRPAAAGISRGRGGATEILTDSKLKITMRDRSNNRKPLQKGRNLSVEAIQAVRALKRAAKAASASGITALEPTLETSFRRLLKLDMMAVLRELLRQNQSYLGLKVFDEIQREYWYKPQVSLYAELVSNLGGNGLIEEVELLFLKLKKEQHLVPDIEGFNALLESLLNFNLTALTIQCMYLMKSIGCELNKLSFKILIDGFESNGEVSLSALLRLEAQKLYGQSLYFLAKTEDDTVS